MAGDSYTRVESVKKACRILSILAEAKEPLTGVEVATRIQLSSNTVMSLLKSLEDEGMIQEVGGGWKLGMKLALFWARVRSGKEAERERVDKDIVALGE